MAPTDPQDLRLLLDAAEARITDLEAERLLDGGLDPLTGLPGARELCERFEVERNRALRHDRPLSLALIDVDGFRLLNAVHGTLVGDEILSTVGWAFQRFLRSYDLAGRATDDEFLVVLPETETDGAVRCFERLLLELNLVDVGPVQGIACSVGVTSVPPHCSSVQLFDAAARALDRARALGGGRIEVAEPVGRAEAADGASDGEPL
jgi:diguanylate cyclase (GGDEF)-like protein